MFLRNITVINEALPKGNEREQKNQASNAMDVRRIPAEV